MTDLISLSPCDGLLPLSIGDLTLTEPDLGVMTSLAPYKGRQQALSEVLKRAHGMAFPAPNRITGRANARAIWLGQGQAMLIGPAPDPALADHAALTEQSDAWAMVRLEGAGAVDVLVRLLPIDLRASRFKRGHTARTTCAQMMASVTRLADQTFQIMVFRSMAETLVHEMKTAMEAVTARR